MSVELITGRGTTDHVGAEDFGAYQAYTFGVGAYILHGCEASVVDSNTVRISEGELLVQGRHVRVKGSEDIAIQSGTAGRNRKDMVCVRYAKDLNGVEDAPLAVIVGTPVEGEASLPPYVQGYILAGDVAADFPLYEIPIAGLVVGVPKAIMGKASDVLSMLADKADIEHEHDGYLPLSGGTLRGGLTFANDAFVFGINSKGQKSSSFEAKTHDNRTTVGYGGYAASEGSTDIYGNVVSIASRGAVTKNGRILYGGTVLYSNATGTTGTVALSESVANFSMIDIFFRDNDWSFDCVRMADPNGKTAALCVSTKTTSGVYWEKKRAVNVSGVAMTNKTAGCVSLNIERNEVAGETGVNNVFITKVIGYV